MGHRIHGDPVGVEQRHAGFFGERAERLFSRQQAVLSWFPGAGSSVVVENA